MKLNLHQLTTKWPRIPLGKLVDFLDSQRKPIKSSERVEGPYPYYGANGLQGHVDGYLFDEKLVLLAEDGGYFFDEVRPITYIVEGKVWVNNHAHVLRARQHIIPEFLNYQLGFAEIKTYLSGSTRAKLTKGDASRIEIICPPLPEQRRIVDILSRAEGIVRLRREAEKKAAELIPALFLDMFGDPATNPKGWPVRKVFDFVRKFEGGKNIQAGSENGSPYRILKVSAVTSGVYRESESKPSPDDYSPPASHIVRVGDMLFSRANTEELVGATAIVEATDGKTLLPDKLWRFVWKEPVEAAYMHALFQSHDVRRELGKLSSGTSASMRNISQGKLFQLPLPIAPYKHQRDFAGKSTMIHSIQSQQAAASSTAQETFDALLAQVFHITGTI